MSLVLVDVESDGPCPGLYSMVSFGAVFLDKEFVLEGKTPKTFYGKTKPISDKWIPEALAISGITREEHLTYPDPYLTMTEFSLWLMKYNFSKRPVFISDNPAFDWQFINYYFHYTMDANPFGHSARRIGDIYSGLTKSMGSQSEWKKFRKTRHDHNPVNDSLGNAEGIIYMIKNLGLKGIT